MIQIVLTVAGLQLLALLLLRGLVWWYFGISRAVRALESIDASLKLLPAVRDHKAKLRRVS